jgi:hypothetical protein
MPRKATRQLIRRATGFYARFWAIVDGEHVRGTRALGTSNAAAARVKLERIVSEALAAPSGTTRKARHRLACEVQPHRDLRRGHPFIS